MHAIIVEFRKSSPNLKILQANKTTKIDKFPRYLLLHMRRYYVDDNWTPKKLDVKVDAPEYLSLEAYRAVDQQVRKFCFDVIP